MAKKEVSKSELLKTAVSAAKAAAKLLLKKQKSAKIKIRKKKGDFALDVDYESERLIKKIIKNKFPNHSFFCEETKFEKHKSDYLWVIDPLDGTINYANKLPLFAVCVAVLFKSQPIVSVIFTPIQKELFHSIKGKGAFLNNKKIHVNNYKKKNNMLLSISPKDWCRFYKKINTVLTRYFRCSGFELAYVACGRLTASIKAKGRKDPFGTAAGALLVEEAGGIFRDIKGKKWCVNMAEGYIASNKAAHKKLLSIFTSSKKRKNKI